MKKKPREFWIFWGIVVGAPLFLAWAFCFKMISPGYVGVVVDLLGDNKGAFFPMLGLDANIFPSLIDLLTLAGCILIRLANSSTVIKFISMIGVCSLSNTHGHSVSYCSLNVNISVINKQIY